MYIISACLLGNNCKYNGGNNRNEKVVEFYDKHDCCIVCPETAGGLRAPRPPAEQQGDRVVDKEGRDLTEVFREGADASLVRAWREAEMAGQELEGAILKANSPSCGCGQIYDGTFSGTLIQGDGVFTRMLKEYDIPVHTEKEI